MNEWDRHHAQLTEPLPYGDPTTYERAAEWMAPCELVEDWGCGGGALAPYIGAERYRGVDASSSPFAAIHADLADYRSDVDGIVIRHVLEQPAR